MVPLPERPMAETSADVTIKDVARQSGVSPMTVSRVINGGERVKPETRRRVEQAITELGYVPSRLARGLSRRRTGTLAVIVPDVANPFFTAVVRAAEEVARRADYRAILCDTRADLAVGTGAGQPSRVRVYLGKDVTPSGEPAATDLDPFAGAVLANGVFVG